MMFSSPHRTSKRERFPSGTWDVVVIGGGPAGAITGGFLAEAGHSTLILEKKRNPGDQLCGEFLSPSAREPLQQFGVFDRIRRTAARVDRAQIFGPSGGTIDVSFSRPALGLSRRFLDSFLLEEAGERGATVRKGWKVTGLSLPSKPGAEPFRLQVQPANGSSDAREVRTRFPVGAFGKRSRMDRLLNRDFLKEPTGFTGLNIPLKRQPSHAEASMDQRKRHCLSLFSIQGGYAGVVRRNDEKWNLCMLVRQEVLPSDSDLSFEHIYPTMFRASEEMTQFLSDFRGTEEETRTIGQIYWEEKSRQHIPFPLVGDAAGMTAPFTGRGQTHALQSGTFLAALLQREGLPQTSHELKRLLGTYRKKMSSRRISRDIARYLQKPLLQEEPGMLFRIASKLPGAGSILYHFTDARRVPDLLSSWFSH